MADEDFTEGMTDTIKVPLLKNGATFDATGMTVLGILKGKDEVAIDTVGDVDWTDITKSQVGYTPDAADLVVSKSPYTMKFKVTASGKDAFYPKGRADRWTIHPT